MAQISSSNLDQACAYPTRLFAVFFGLHVNARIIPSIGHYYLLQNLYLFFTDHLPISSNII
jgi:hypothetical protein